MAAILEVVRLISLKLCIVHKQACSELLSEQASKRVCEVRVVVAASSASLLVAVLNQKIIIIV